MKLNSTEEILADLRQGKMVIIMDDKDRENEGDLIMAASLVRPEDVNFMATHGRGLICLTLTCERCQQLQLPLMVRDTDEKRATNFTISIEAAQGVTTGISAHDRSQTIRAAVAPYAKPDDIIQPGHIFPLMAQPGGVLARAGHTEAGCDLARLAGLEATAVIVEVLKEDGTMARRPDLEVFAQLHGLKIGTIADLIHYRIANEKTVDRVAECDFPTEYGDFQLYAYQDNIDNLLHVALVHGDISRTTPLVRVHVQDRLCDLFAALRDDCSWPLRRALTRIAKEDSGIVVVLGHVSNVGDIVRRLRGELVSSVVASEGEGGQPRQEIRTYGAGAQILADLGVSKMRVLSAPKIMHGLSGFGLEVTEYVEPK
ncbi:MAG: bifunctional 3,4-dihydroxy-2-butanone-4-phosphate synthase/GTP cyclohydrolase II [Gammaproteobacteria bacterium]|nr:MAG: bifunctional 3,4-dihydroxy-2-butanone-4-phosphate synthase/GTP cyclohydrolase II [Gammaproteobacteria bacterium]